MIQHYILELKYASNHLSSAYNIFPASASDGESMHAFVGILWCIAWHTVDNHFAGSKTAVKGYKEAE